MAITGKIWRDGQVSELGDVRALSELIRDPDLLIWVDVCEPNEERLSVLGDELGLDAHTIEDAITRYERPKAIRLGSYTFTTLHTVTAATEGATAWVRAGRVSAYALPTALLTIRPNDNFDLQPVFDLLATDDTLVGFGVDGLLHGLLDVVIDQYFEVLQQLDDGCELLTDQLFADRPDLREIQKETFQMRRELVHLNRAITPMRGVIETLLRLGQGADHWTAELASYYQDLNDHILRAFEWASGLREMLASLYETSLALNDARLNEVMKKLAAWAAIIAVPTLITGWFGMNVPYFGFGAELGVVISTVLVVVAAVTLFIVFRRKDWL